MEPPLRVLLLNNYPPPRGGAETHVAALEGILRGAGHAVESHAPGESAGWPAVRDRIHNPGVARLVAERIAAFRPDVVHVHNFLRRLSVAPFPAARAAGVPTLLTVHDFQLFCPRTWAVRADGSPCGRPSLPLCALGNCRGGLRGPGGRLVYLLNTFRQRWAAGVVRREATAVAAPSRALADRLAATLRREVLHLPYPFPEAPPFEAAPSGDLLFLGRIAPEKGLDGLLRALPGAPGVRLTVAGDGPALPAARDLARDLGLGERIRFEGWVDAARVPGLLRDHAALVVPSVWMENSPLVVHEALAAGRPVLGSDRGGIPGLVADGVEGLLFDPLAGGSLPRALSRWAALGPGEREAMGRRARERAAAGGPAAFLPRIVSLYRTVIQTGAGGGP